MVKAAFASWNDRIAPVFDVARRIQLVESEAGQIINQKPARVASDIPNQKVSRLAELEIGVLVCGAISKPMQAIIRAYGIKVIPFIAGDLQEVIQAWLCGKLSGSALYTMPGCPKARGRRLPKAPGNKRRQPMPNGHRQGQKGSGPREVSGNPRRQGRKRTGQAQGRRNGQISDPGAAASYGNCVCPQCGHQAPHERAVPCLQKKCAQCGAVMTRQ
jgi:predicted Fe-Mo cluster-binding NifX family protein